ncbi:MAG: hypothetical protein WDA16_11375 [Candidatus Thermoplasmatota archaeon]
MNGLARNRFLFLGILALVAGTGAFTLWTVPPSMSVPALGLYVIPIVTFATIGGLFALRYPRARPREPSTARPMLHAALVLTTLCLGAAALATTRGQSVWKPLSFYALYAAACTTLLVQALVAPRARWAIALCAVQSAALLALVALTTQLMTAEGFGADTVFHRKAAETIVATGSHDHITVPYSVFTGLHDQIALLRLAGAPPRVALALTGVLIGVATVTAAALFLGRAFGSRSAMVGAALVAFSPRLLETVATISPSKMGVWALIAVLAFASMPGIAPAGVAVAMGALAFFYHPTLGFAFLVAASVYIGFVHVLGVEWLARLGGWLGFGRNPSAARRTGHWWALPTGIVALSALALAWVDLRAPRLIPFVLNTFNVQGDQSGAIGAAHVTTNSVINDFMTQTMLLDVTTAVLVIPAFYVLTRSLVTPGRRPAFLVTTALASVVGVAALITVARLFILGVGRFLALEDILITIVAAPAVVLMLQAVARAPPVWFTVVLVISGVAFVSAASYRIDGSDLLWGGIPKQTDYVAKELTVAAETLRPTLTEKDRLASDLYSGLGIASFPSHTYATLWEAPLNRYNTTVLEGEAAPAAGTVLLHSKEAAARAHDTKRWQAIDQDASVLYANGIMIGGVA